ncbi:MAG: AtpZ/AtpI family protein [Desulfurivibrio sp.]
MAVAPCLGRGITDGTELMAGERKEVLKLLATFGTIGMTMVFSIFIGLGVGYFLDHKVFDGRTAPWLTMLFLAFGVAAAFKNMYTLSQRKDL